MASYKRKIKRTAQKFTRGLFAFLDWGGEKTFILLKKLKRITKRALRKTKKLGIGKIILFGVIAMMVLGGGALLWVSTFELPNLENFEDRQIAESTKIYDRTGDVVLFDVHGEITRTVVPFDAMSDYVKWATIAIEDENFYNHIGIEPKAIARAIITNLKDGDLLGGQGGSTITQQVIKNSLLTSDKKVSRKIKEWVLAPRLEQILTKDEILEVYLNEAPYGGTVYGVQEAARRFFGKDVKDITLAEAAYMASLPQLPTYYSPYGNNKADLDLRKNRVLKSMRDNKFITQKEFDEAMNETVVFQPQENFGIKAPHFVFWIREQLEEKYGAEVVEQGGLKIITTLDWELQEQAEETVKKWALLNEEKHDAENGSIVAIDPNTGQVLTMVGSRDYFDTEIQGNFNIATANRQPGSAFKPIVYAEAFSKGFRPETVVFDVPTEFSATCSSGGNCYSPVNYDGKFNGPMSLRNALAQSVNIPAVKVLYMAGLEDSLSLAKRMGLETLTNIKQYGLTLVLGGGEVRPIDMASAYAVFANEGFKHRTTGVLRVEDSDGKVLEEYEEKATRVMDQETARLVSDVISDNIARTPAFGASSFLNFPGISVAAKTGTTNDYRDAWIVGYTPNISVAAWAGNNDNRSMDKKVAGFIVAPMWNEFMQVAIEKYPAGAFGTPPPISADIKPMMAGFWKGEDIIAIDKETGELADEDTPVENLQLTTRGGGNIHTILNWVDKNNPLGPAPSNPGSDGQYAQWEYAVQLWLNQQGYGSGFFDQSNGGGNDNQPTNTPSISILNPSNGDSFFEDSTVYVAISANNAILSGGEVYINGENAGAIDVTSGSFSFVPSDITNIKKSGNTLEVRATDSLGNAYKESVTFSTQ